MFMSSSQVISASLEGKIWVSASLPWAGAPAALAWGLTLLEESLPWKNWVTSSRNVGGVEMGQILTKQRIHMERSLLLIAWLPPSPSTNGSMQTCWRCLSFVTRQPAVLSCEAAASLVMHHFICVLLFPLTRFLFLSLLPSWDKTSKALKIYLGVGFPGNLGFDIHEGAISPKL